MTMKTHIRTIASATLPILRAATPLLGLTVLLGACEGAPGPDEIVRTSSAASQQNPQGLTCGVAYQNGGIWIDGACNFKRTLASPPEHAPDYHLVNDGDTGLMKGDGFYHQALDMNQDLARPVDAKVPPGTTCGFKHTCNPSKVEKCFGLDPAQACPLGWFRVQASDARANSGCNFVWCEYLDPQGLCPNSACPQPFGLACGMSDSDASNGQGNGFCQGFRITRGSRCPTGYSLNGPFDNGRTFGHGLVWCSKDHL
jgi:hypothetical protein